MQPETTARIMEALESLMSSHPSAARSSLAIQHYSFAAGRIDAAIRAAINASLCLAGDDNNRLVAAFDDGIAGSGRNVGSRHSVLASA